MPQPSEKASFTEKDEVDTEHLLEVLGRLTQLVKDKKIETIALSFTDDDHGETHIIGDEHGLGHTMNQMNFQFAKFAHSRGRLTDEEMQKVEERFNAVEARCVHKNTKQTVH